MSALWKRVLTSLVLVAVLGGALWYSGEGPFGLLALSLIALAVWEWSRLNGMRRRYAIGSSLVFSALMLVLWWFNAGLLNAPWLWPLMALMLLMLLPLALWRGIVGWRAMSRNPRLLLGWMLLAQAWWALLNAKAIGVTMLVSIFMLVWAADIAAYVGGRRFGRRKLAPQISPGKTWEGVASAALGVLLLAALWLVFWPSHWGPNLFEAMWAFGPPWALLLMVMLLALCVMGDLFESMVKRSVGRKDSSRILPGHGGVLDRFDALLAVLPLALAIVTWPQSS